MIDIEQAKVLRRVLAQFKINDEILEWTEFDTNMELLTWLTDDELCREAAIKFETHMRRDARCTKNHPRDQCFIPIILDAVAIILDHHEEAGNLIKHTRYMLEFYLSLTQTGEIVTD